MTYHPSAPKKSGNAGTIAFVLLLIACPASIATVGILAAIAIPAFVGYMRRAKVAEASANLSEIAQHMESYHAEFGRYPSAPATPPTPPCARKEIFPADPSWAQIGFAPSDPVYFSYEAQGTTDHYVIRARGDLDCDGVTSLFERSSEQSTLSIENESE